MVRQTIVMLYTIILFVGGCCHEEKEHVIPFIKSLKSIENEFCFSQKMHIIKYQMFGSWERYLESMCECKKSPLKRDSGTCNQCVKTIARISSEDVPRSLLKGRPFILLTMGEKITPDPQCFDFKKICDTKPFVRFVFDSKTYQLIDTPRTKKAKTICNRTIK